MIRLALVALVVCLAGCRRPSPTYEYEPWQTTVSGGVEVPAGEAVSTTTTLPPRPPAWSGPQRW